MRSLIGSIRGFPGTGAVGLPGPAQFDLALAAHAEFIICDQSIDEVFLRINGKRHDLWRAVDQDDNVLDILVQRRRNKKAASPVSVGVPRRDGESIRELGPNYGYGAGCLNGG
jgi:hypothetical protein